MLEFVETHTHLFMPPLADDITGVLERARQNAVTRCIVPAYDLASWSDVIALARDDVVYPALGQHPWVAAEPLDILRLEQLLRDSGAVAVGEIGLDFKIETPGPEIQMQVCKQQLQLASDLDLPVILHCRGAFEQLLACLEVFTPRLRGVLHAFSRGPDLAQRFAGTGLYIAFGGAVTRPRAKQARRSAEILPLDKIVLETDSPSIGLEDVPPQQVEPRHVRQVAAALAEIRGETLETIAEVTTANAKELFGL